MSKKLLLEIESEYWFDADSVESALNDYFGKEWKFIVTNAAQKSVQPTVLCTCKLPGFDANNPAICPTCKMPHSG